jgi:hypothetical protein
MKECGEVARAQRAGATVFLPELLPEHLKELTGHADLIRAIHSVVGHGQQPDSLFGHVHQLEGDVLARNQLAQAGEHVGVEDVVVGGRLARFEHVQQSADVGIGHDPVTGHGATSDLSVPPGYGEHAREDIRVCAYADRSAPTVEFRSAGPPSTVES